MLTVTGLSITYSPPVALFVPKLLPTTPVHRHIFPAEFFQVAVAVALTFKHATVRFSRDSTGEATVRAAAVNNVRTVDFMATSNRLN